MAGAFDGIRILDFTQGIAGPMATMFLADFGAQVIKVEPPAGDRLRAHPGYLCWNRNKQVLTVDLHTDEGLAAARGLIATAEVAVFDGVPGELERLGLDAVTVTSRNPSLLHAWLPPIATRGRWSQLPPDDALLAAVSGAAFMQTSYDDQPVWLVTPQVSYGHAFMGAAAIAAALHERQRSGRGQALTVTGLQGMGAVEATGVISAPGMVRMLSGSPRGGSPNYRLYQCADGEWLFLGTLTPAFFLKALGALDLLDVMAMPGVEGEFTNLLLKENGPAVIARLDARFAERPRAEWLRILHEADVPRAPVGRREDWFHGETVAANAMRTVLEHPALGPVEMPGVSMKMLATPGAVRSLPTPLTLDDVSPRSAAVQPSAPAAAGSSLPGPLAGVRVLDLGGFIAGAYAPAILAGLGADVVKVEPPDGDGFRVMGLNFAAVNRGKRGLALDLKHPDGLAAFHDLVRESDVVLDNYRLGVRERLRIDYATLAAINPRIITCSVTGYGPAGELANDPGFDPLMQARSGIMAGQGSDDEPVFHHIPVTDNSTAILCAFAIAAALHARERTGRGQEVTTCLANQSVVCQSGELTSYHGRPANPAGGRDCLGVAALRRFYRCADGWLALAAAGAHDFPGVAVALGHPEWAGRMTAEQAFAEPRDGQLAALVAEAFAAVPLDDALDRLLARGVPAAPATTVDAVAGDPWLAQNAFTVEFDHPLHGPVRAVRALADFSRTPAPAAGREPLLGEHTAAILRDYGFDDARIGSLLVSGAAIQR